jgi:alanine dehydrogenase
MIIGVPKEIKNNENRVGLTPAGVAEFKKHGHQVFVQSTAGDGSGFKDEDYQGVGAEILDDIASV